MSDARIGAMRRRLGRNMRLLRADLDLSQQQAATRGHMHVRHWQKLERGEVSPSLTSLVKVAIAFGCDVVALLAPPPKP